MLTARIAPNQRTEFARQFYSQATTIGLVLVHVGRLGNPAAIVGNQVCLRLFRKDIESEQLAHQINEWLAAHETEPSKIHLVLDLQTLDSIDQSYLTSYSQIPMLDDWNTVTIVGGSFSKDLRALSVGEHLLRRLEWHYWKQLISTRL